MNKLMKRQRGGSLPAVGCGVIANILLYYMLRSRFEFNVTKANFCSLLLFVIVIFIFDEAVHSGKKEKSSLERVEDFFLLAGDRLLPSFLEIYGVVMLSCVWGVPDMAGKFALQIVSLLWNIVLNKMYLFDRQKKDLCAEEIDEYEMQVLCVVLGFGVPAITMLVAYIVNGVYPFGDHGVLIIDSLHQYLPFFTDFHDKLVNNQSLLYSFGGGLGYNMWAAFAYYLASPLNLLICFVSREHVMDFMAYLILLKISLSGGVFAWYLSKKGKRKDLFPAVFASMYALSAFMIGYYFNLMWLDSIMVVPILMYGIEKIVEGKNGRTFGMALFYGLFCNYYIGYMLCLFSSLYFLILWGGAKRFDFWKFLKSGIRFTCFALLSGGMAAAVLIPAYMNLQITESAGSSFPSKIKFYVSELEQFTGHFAFVEPINIYDNQSGVNVYCGVAILILAVLYLLDRKIGIAERASKFALAALLALSMNLNILNYIWHGFHIQNGLPNRFAFLYIALLLSMGYEALNDAQKLSVGRRAIAWVIPVSLTAYCMAMEIGDREWYVYMVTMLLLVVYGIFVIACGLKGKMQHIMRCLLGIVMTVEMIATGIYGVGMNGTVGRSSYVNDQISYQTMIRRQNAEGFYRSEVDSQRMRNENMFIGANGMVLFSSTMPEATVNLCRSIGIEARTNKNGYIGVTKLFNDVFGIRYVLSKKNSEELYNMKQVDYEEPMYLYENKDALSLGFMVSSDIRDWDIELGLPMDIQRMFATLATGEPFSYTLRESYDLEEGPTYIIRLHPGEQTYLELTENVKSVTIKTPQGEKTYNNYNDNLFDLGRVYTEGEDSKANVSIVCKEGKQESVPVRVYTCKDEEYQAVYDKLAKNQMKDVKVSGNFVSGTIQAEKDGCLLLTVPYDQGWKVFVDEKETETYRVGEALTGVDLGQGEHTIRMEFIPDGLMAGTWIGAVCMLLYLIACIAEGQANKKRGNNSESGIL